MSPQITFHPKDRAIEVPEGATPLKVTILAGMEKNSARGRCT